MNTTTASVDKAYRDLVKVFLKLSQKNNSFDTRLYWLKELKRKAAALDTKIGALLRE